jgi:UDP-N-acetylmuramoyl-tripeptide--D-alanyl-D-alanine ligase
MRFLPAELATALDADLVLPPGGEPGAAPAIEGLSIDSRRTEPSQLFAALTDERDGHDFVPDAVAAGAAAVLVERVVTDAVPSLVVSDVPAALLEMSRHARRRLPERVVGVTGSVGKTTTKDLLAGVLAERFVTTASERSFNNELGVPLTLCNAPGDVAAVVVEMGARGLGHIALLCELARPTVGVVTTVQAVHTELMGGVEQIAVAKGELVEALPETGLAVLNADVPLVAAMRERTRAEVLTFGEGGDVRAGVVRLDDELRPSFELHSPWGVVPVRLGIRGEHNVANALAAAAVGLWSGVPLEQVAAGLGAGELSPWRMDLRTAASGARVLNDAYNASPASMAAALRSLAALAAERHIAVLGAMGELGEDAPAHHRRVADLAGELGVRIVAVGTPLYGVEPVPDVDAAVAELAGLGPGDAVLVKASRVAGLERVAAALAGEDG